MADFKVEVIVDIENLRHSYVIFKSLSVNM